MRKADEPAEPASTPRTRLVRGLLVGGLPLLLFAVAPLLVPMDVYRRAVETALGDAFGESVRIERMRVILRTSPAVILEDLRVGGDRPGGFTLTAKTARASVALRPLLGGRLELSDVRWEGITARFGEQGSPSRLRLDACRGAVRVDGKVVTVSSLACRLYRGRVRGRFRWSSDGERGAFLGQLRLRDVQLRAFLADVAAVPRVAGRLDADVSFAVVTKDRGSPPAYRVRGPVTLHAALLRLPELGIKRLRLDELRAGIDVTSAGLKVRGARARLYRGGVAFHAALAPWVGPSQRLDGRVHIEGVALSPLLRDVADRARISGRLSGDLVFQVAMARGRIVRRSLRVHGPLRLTDGAFDGAGARGVIAERTRGDKKDGKVPFDRLSLRLRVLGDAMRAERIALRAPGLVVGGEIRVGPDDRLAGRLTVTGPGVGKLAEVGLNLAGTTEHPLIYPDAGTVLGGAVGAVVGGPMGAAVGVGIGGKIGRVMESIGKGFKDLFRGHSAGRAAQP